MMYTRFVTLSVYIASICPVTTTYNVAVPVQYKKGPYRLRESERGLHVPHVPRGQNAKFQHINGSTQPRVVVWLLYSGAELAEHDGMCVSDYGISSC